MKQVICWVRLISQDIAHPLQTTGVIDSVDIREIHPDDFPSCPHHSLEGPLFSLSAAGKPHQKPINQYALDGTMIEIHKELLGKFDSPQFPKVKKQCWAFPTTEAVLMPQDMFIVGYI